MRHDGSTDAGHDPRRPHQLTSAIPPKRRVRQVIAWGIGLLGLALLVLAFVGSAVGFTVLPFDRHHVIGQAGGVLIGVLGMSLATRK